MAVLPELREAEAPPEIAAVYAALRQATGVPLVNLIWRHLATLPGALPWAWSATRAALESGAVAAARERVAAALRLPPGLAHVDAVAWRAAGLGEADRGAVLAVAETYNRGNLTNLVLLTALRRAIEGAPMPGDDAAAAGPAATVEVPGLPPVPPLPVLDALPEDTAALVRGLAARHTGVGAAGVLPSLYLHLAHWPPLLAALPAWLGPLLDSPAALATAREAAIALATAEADRLRPRLAAGAGVPNGQGAAVAAALARFTTAVIPEMVPVGLALRRVLTAA
jgi:hypothetical protein